MGTPIQGKFGTFEAQISFDPASLDQASVNVTIDLASVDTGNAERDTEIKGPVWFDTGNEPKAVFRSNNFAADGDAYRVDGELTIRGVTQQVEMPVTIDVDGDTARAAGEIAVNRVEYEVGTGQWASDATVGTTVTIRFEIEAER